MVCGCKYYDALEVLVNRMFDGEIDEAEYDRRCLELLDEELSGEGAEWLVYHYTTAAEVLLDALYEGDVDGEQVKNLLRNAYREMDIFAAHGHEFVCNRIAEMLAEVREMICRNAE